jgi:hypothetical protein
MAFDPCVGTEGRIALGAGSTAVAGIMEWRLNKQLTPIPINHFELTADGDGIVWQVFEKGLASATATLRGHYNVDATDKTEGGTPGIKIGATLTLDLLFTRGPFGYTNLACFVTGFETGTNIENQTGTFTATVQMTGTVAVAA